MRELCLSGMQESTQPILDKEGNKTLGNRITRTRWVAVVVVFFAILAFLAVTVLSLEDSGESFGQAITGHGFVTIVWTSVLSVALGVLSSLAYGTIENSGAKAELFKIRNLTNPELLDQILEVASEYGNKTCSNRSVRYRLEQTSNDKILKLTGEYLYTRKIEAHSVAFKFMRLRSAKDREAHTKSVSNSLEQLRNSELYLVMDEVEIRAELGLTAEDPLLDAFYSVSDFRIDGMSVQIQDIARTDFEYSAPIPDSFHGKEVRLSYTVTCPLSYADYFFSYLSLPTHKNEISLDYKSLNSVLWVDGVEAFSAMENAIFSDRDGKGALHISHGGWALPRSGVMFVWGKR